VKGKVVAEIGSGEGVACKERRAGKDPGIFLDGRSEGRYYMSAIYQHIAVFYLLDKGQQDAMGGTFYKALKRIGHERLLEPIQQVLDTPIGSTTFGELVRVFRNKAIVHTSYQDADLDRLYKSANMGDPQTARQFQDTLLDVYHVTRLLAPDLIERAGFRLADFGIRETSEKTRRSKRCT
jgi:hypothetical protein